MRQQGDRLHGLVEVATAALDGGLSTIEGVHTAIARKPFGALGAAPVVGEVSEVVRAIHDGVTSLIYGGVRIAIAVAGGAGRVAASVARSSEDEPRSGSPAGMALSALNGFAGDRLHRDGNPLATTMALRRDGRAISPWREELAAAYPDASSRLAVFVHGLMCDESMWRLHADRHYGDPHVTYGSRLQADTGHTPLYLRYNTGLHVSDNGRELARLLDRVVAAWPVPVEEVVLVGHSMGGLVVRSACHYGEREAHDFVARVRHVVFLGTPHLGAPLEKAAHVLAWLLARTEVTRPFAEALNVRSVGIKDLRFGTLREEDWPAGDPDALLVDPTGDVPLLDGANHYTLAATITRDPRHPLGVAVGDLLVREASARGRGRVRRIRFPLENGRHLGPMNHLELLNHPDVYAQLRRWLDGSGE